MINGPCLDETTGARLLAGELPPDEADLAHHHVATCRDCQEFVAALARTCVESSPDNVRDPAFAELDAELPRGTTVGRFLVLGRLGSGGMGVVHAAYDPELDRRVALKLLRRGSEGEGHDVRARLLREAKAAARLSHPNVVSVFDIGMYEDRVYLAMEYVEGVTLAEWLRGDRRWQLVVDMFIQAGRGIAAAHEAGVIHRDFKPDNVLVGRDGRARVVDFGLARADIAGVATDCDAVDSTPPHGSVSPPLTRTGTVMGTPAYMAPEQHEGGTVGPACDQFALCASLWEALFEVRPFAGQTYAELAANVRAGNIADPPANRNVPGWLRDVVRRGLRLQPADRWPTMTGLLAALAHDPVVARRQRLRRAGVIVAVVALGGLAVFGLSRDTTVRDTRCQAMDAPLVGVWDRRRGAVRAAFVATGRRDAADTFDRVATRLDGYTRDLLGARVDACEATHLRGEQSDTLLDLRMVCLNQRITEVRALVDVFAKGPNTSVLDKAIEATLKLRSLDSCANVNALQAVVAPPAEVQTRKDVDKLREALAEAKALDETAQYAAGLAIVGAATTDAARIGYAPAWAEALSLRARLERNTGGSKAARATLEQALAVAADAHDDALAALIWADLVFVVGSELALTDEALLLRPGAEAALRRGGEPEADARLQNSLGAVFLAQGKHAEAQRHFEHALALREKSLGPDHPRVAESLTNLGIVLKSQGRYAEARARLERAIATYEKVLGPNHPRVADAATNLGNVLDAQGKFDDAQRHHERALAIFEGVLGPGHPRVAAALTNLGNMFELQGKYDEAQRYYERALTIAEQALGPDHPTVTSIETNLGIVLNKQGKHDEARRHYERVLAVQEKIFGPGDHRVAMTETELGNVFFDQGNYDAARPHYERSLAIDEKAVSPDDRAVGLTHNSLGDLYLAQGKYDEARRHHERAVAIHEKAAGANHPDLAYALSGLAEDLLSLGHVREAQVAAERAVQIRAALDTSSTELAESRFVLARVLWAVGGEHPRALALAHQARDVVAKAGDRSSVKVLASVDRWLADHHR